mmetsp:Transcript_40081/g.72200  ORF Transcript_40081/g.72200 Transcript_40081/m.72200 type:complete len:346 (-) Transcript_40081:137-1174(-)
MSDDPLDALAETEKLIIKQEVSLLEAAAQNLANAVDMDALGNLGETANKYDIYTDDGGHKFKVIETSEACGFTGCCPSGRLCCNPNHALQLHIFAPEHSKDQAIMYADRPCKCGSCCAVFPICTQEMTVYSGPDSGPPGGDGDAEREIAYITQPFLGGFLSPELNVMDRNGDGDDGEQIATIKANGICCIGGICCDQTFNVTSPDGEYMGKIVKEAPEGIGDALKELATDSDNFTMYVPKALDTKKKAAMLGALHLIDYMFFEQGGSANVDLTSVMEGSCPEVTFKCCDLYCCGCVCPCTCTLGGGGDDDGEEGGGDGEEDADGEEEPEEEPEEEEEEEEPEEEE